MSLACSGDDDTKDKKAKSQSTPEFVREARSAPTMGTLPPPIITSSGPGAASVSTGPIAPPSVAGPSSSTHADSGGLTVRHVETATVAADQAFVVIQLQSVPGPGPFTPGISGRQQEQVTSALTAIGVKKDDINFETSSGFGPFASISVPVPVKDLATRGKQVADAIERAVGSRPQSGARFALSDCRTALDPLRKKAIEGAHEDAKALAAASSLTLGSLRAVNQSLSQGSIPGPPSDPCSGSLSARPPGSLLALDAEPKVTINLQVDATYALGSGTADGGLSVTGTGKATAKADEAYIVVTVFSSSPGPFGPAPVSKKSRDELVTKLKALKIDEDDIQIENVFNGPGQTVVSVEAPIADLAKTSKDVVSAVEDVLGRSQNQGVWFSHSNCAAVLAEARKQAIADAKRSAEALAGSASIKLGSLTSLSEGPVTPIAPYGSPATTDPCTDNVASLFQASSGPYGQVNLKPFDSTPEFTVNSSVTVTYAIQP
jgi:uncharacterized protein YggE